MSLNTPETVLKLSVEKDANVGTRKWWQVMQRRVMWTGVDVFGMSLSSRAKDLVRLDRMML